ncbi:LysR substrate-binding domain-containing protein [Trinickia acidisoli]|uniref:LysR substrate-binding domain-containing protein n=1 Tax=Trinickia acidisoli TaxID=2767482 RepID=UPI001A8DA3FC|nr:LysR substrate-binding domain-containing protein [Trinickia acidisoli]
MDLDIDLLRTFLAIVRDGGFTRAATHLNKTQSTVSLHVRRLEEVTGQTLFHRKARGTGLSEEGEVFRAYAEKIVELHDEAVGRMRAPVITGDLRLGILEDFATLLLPRALKRFSKSYPGVRLDVRAALTAELMKALGDGDLDLVLARRTANSEEGELIWRERLVWVDGRDEPGIEEALPLVMFPHGCVYRPLVLRAMRTYPKPWSIVYTSTSLGGVQAAVQAGIGVTVLAESTVGSNLTVLDDPELPSIPDTELAFFQGRPANEAAQMLKAHLRHELANYRPEAIVESDEPLLERI